MRGRGFLGRIGMVVMGLDGEVLAMLWMSVYRWCWLVRGLRNLERCLGCYWYFVIASYFGLDLQRVQCVVMVR